MFADYNSCIKQIIQNLYGINLYNATTTTNVLFRKLFKVIFYM